MLKQVKAEILYKAGVFRTKQSFWQSLKFKKSINTSKDGETYIHTVYIIKWPCDVLLVMFIDFKKLWCMNNIF